MLRISVHTLAVAVLSLGSAVPAQGRHVFVIDSPQSAFTFSGQVTILGISGPLVGNPANFNISGDAAVDLTVAGGTLTTGQLVVGSSVVSVPPLAAVVPNPIPFLPPLATVNVTATQLVITSVDPNTLAPISFPVAANGSFSTSVVADILSGSATFTALGTTQTIGLAGVQSTPQAISGTIVPTASGFRLQVPFQATFAFADPTSGASGSLSLTGNIVADDLPLATDVDTISLQVGGAQTFTLSAGTAHGGDRYLVVGSITGTQPGFMAGSVHIPLNPDDYTVLTAVSPNMPPMVNSLGVLDALGVGSAAFALPRLPIPALIGLRFDHAYVAISGAGIVFASNPVPLTLVRN